MKKVFCLVLLLAPVLLVGLVSRNAAPDGDLLRQAEQAYHSKRNRVTNTRYITLIDYRKSIVEPRLWVVDRKTNKVVLASLVSHALNSGFLYATAFSNVNGSEKSCAGSFLTQGTYHGKFGFSLRIRGLDADNSNALTRAIIFHAAPFGHPFSKACFMTDPATNKKLINMIQGGSFIFVSK